MSREAELFKDKIEVSLDGRQIFYLFFGGAVIVGLVFVLGVMVGRRVEARGHVDRARVAATVDPLAALDRLEGGTNLSFQGALRGGETPASDVENKIAAMQKADAAPKKADKDAKKADEPARAEAKKADASHDEPKTEAKKSDEKSDGKKSDEKSDSKKSDDKVEAKKSDDKVETKKSDDKPETKKSDEKSDAKKTADADDTRGSPASAGARPPTEEKKQKYTLQLSSFQDKREAEAYLDSIKSAGYEARVTEGTVDGKQYYRVRMGSYRSVEAANDAKAEFEKGAKKSAIVTKL
jgi:DedD protein